MNGCRNYALGKCEIAGGGAWGVLPLGNFEMSDTLRWILKQILFSLLALSHPNGVLVGGGAHPLPPSGFPTGKNPVFGSK